MSREIYQCPVTQLFYDPLAVRRKLIVGSKGEINSWLKDHRSPEEAVSSPADEKVLQVARVALQLPPVDLRTGRGVVDDIVFHALDAFLEYLTVKKEKGQTSQTSSPCVECPQT